MCLLQTETHTLSTERDFIELKHKAPMKRAAYRTTKTAPGLGGIQSYQVMAAGCDIWGQCLVTGEDSSTYAPFAATCPAPPASHCTQTLHSHSGSSGLFLQHYLGLNSEEQALNRQCRTNTVEKNTKQQPLCLAGAWDIQFQGTGFLFLPLQQLWWCGDS